MQGGINAWEGLVAEGMPEVGLSFFASAKYPEEYIALAWLLEDGTGNFYRSLTEHLENEEAIRLFEQLVMAEEHHKSTLTELYVEITGKPAEADFPFSHVPAVDGEYMEGGMELKEAISWAKGKSIVDILDFSVTLEANAYDRYLFIRDELNDTIAKRVFATLSLEEKHHLDRLSDLLDKVL